MFCFQEMFYSSQNLVRVEYHTKDYGNADIIEIHDFNTGMYRITSLTKLYFVWSKSVQMVRWLIFNLFDLFDRLPVIPSELGINKVNSRYLEVEGTL